MSKTETEQADDRLLSDVQKYRVLAVFEPGVSLDPIDVRYRLQRSAVQAAEEQIEHLRKTNPMLAQMQFVIQKPEIDYDAVLRHLNMLCEEKRLERWAGQYKNIPEFRLVS